jgi:hypothetical protein
MKQISLLCQNRKRKGRTENYSYFDCRYNTVLKYKDRILEAEVNYYESLYKQNQIEEKVKN